MGWLERCYQVYEKNLPHVGKPSASIRYGWDAPVLLPVAHTTQKVNVELILSEAGEFLTANVLCGKEMTTVIPCTEESLSRTSKAVPHPLVDKLQYIAGDYTEWGGSKKQMWEEYIAQLQAWCDSPFGLESVRAVLAYLTKGCLIQDLVDEGILFADEEGHLLKKWNGKKDEAPEIFHSLTNGDQFETFVRFRVSGKDLSEDPAVWDSYTGYYLSTLEDVGVCYVQGKEMPVSLLSPYKIRNAADRAKLISSNDKNNFTFRGRFRTAQEALSIGYETTQKAHSALRWLIGRQGVQNGSQAILVWGTENEPVPPVETDTCDFIACGRKSLKGMDGMEEDYDSQEGRTRSEPDQGNAETERGYNGQDAEDADADNLDQEENSQESVDSVVEGIPRTREEFAAAFNKVVQGYRAVLTPYSKISVIILDSATPGRLSVCYYRELQGSRLMDNIVDWHTTFQWELRYRKLRTRENGKEEWTPLAFEGAPAPADIVTAAYGAKVDKKLKQHTIERLLPCITERRKFPKDIMLAAAHRASNGIALKPWEANKNRSIACALIRGYYHRNLKEEYTMALDETCSDRSYLFGRILACAEQLEQYAAYLKGEKNVRPTNALRYEVAYTKRPARTLALLRKQLEPYLESLIKAKGKIDENDLMLRLIDRIPLEEFNDRPLTELYLLGYASQRQAFFKDAASKSGDQKAETETSPVEQE